ncbi:MAG: GFA family protein, partial [Sulfitobacter sp.]
RRSDPAQCGVNLGCIEGVATWEHEPVVWTDGQNHPSDRR